MGANSPIISEMQNPLVEKIGKICYYEPEKNIMSRGAGTAG
jgi:hypothetical protein